MCRGCRVASRVGSCAASAWQLGGLGTEGSKGVEPYPSRITRNREGEEKQIPSGLSFERDRPTSGGVQEIRDMATEGEQGMSHFISKSTL